MIIEQIVLNHLQVCLDVPIYAERPEKPDITYILIEKTGSGRRNRVDRATIAVQSYAGTAFEAAMLNSRVKAAMDVLPQRTDVSACRLNSDYNFTDTGTKEYRYQAVFDITYFERED